MADCKTEILNSIPSSSCCGLAFFSTILLTSSQIDFENSRIMINLKPEIIQKLTKVIHKHYNFLEIDYWDNFMIVKGDLSSILNDLKPKNETEPIKLTNSCCKLTFIKTLFLISGNFYYSKDNNTNSKGYNLEISIKDNYKLFLENLLKKLEINLKYVKRYNNAVFYSKNSSEICDILVKLGAVYTSLDVQNSLAMREMRNTINRQNNCFESNLNKTLDVSTEQIKAINYLIETNNFDYLDENLKEVAFARLANPDVSLSELQKLMTQQISRAGIKYRLDKILELYKKLKGEI